MQRTVKEAIEAEVAIRKWPADWRHELEYPKYFWNNRTVLPNIWGSKRSYYEYPVFQEGHPSYRGARPSGPGPVRVQIQMSSSGPPQPPTPSPDFQHFVTYHDPREGPDGWTNVVMAERISKSDTVNDAAKLTAFKDLFRKSFHACHEALNIARERAPNMYR